MTRVFKDCVFCQIIIDKRYEECRDGLHGRAVIFTPLNPVVKGHKLVVPVSHAESVMDDEFGAADAMYVAADYIHRHYMQANIITSVGPAATQTVFHTHLHIVPRHKDDGLLLPWTNQVKEH